MKRSILVPLLVAALLTLSGCGVVKDAAKRAVAKALGASVAAQLGVGTEEAEAAEEPAGGGGLSIAADEDAAQDVVAEDEEDSGTPGFYKIVEPNGTVRFTSNLSELSVEQRSKAERLAMAPSRPSAARSAPPPRGDVKQLAAATAPQPPASRARSGSGPHEVVLYTTSWCGWCKKTRSWLDGQGVEYTDKDIESDDGAADEMRELVGGDSGVPVVVIDGEVIRGFNQKKMAQLLEI